VPGEGTQHVRPRGGAQPEVASGRSQASRSAGLNVPALLLAHCVLTFLIIRNPSYKSMTRKMKAWESASVRAQMGGLGNLASHT